MDNEFFESKLDLNLDIDNGIDTQPKYSINDIEHYIIKSCYMTPSEFELGIEEKEEKSFRWIIAKLINECGIVTRIKHNAILTSLKLMHYIYFKIEISKYDAIIVAITCIVIACKLEECQIDFNKIAKAMTFLFSSEKNGGDKEAYPNLKMKVNKMELIIMKELGYYLSPFGDHPHKYLLHFIKKIKNDLNLFKKAWGYLNDLYFTSCVVNFNNSSLVCASIFYASRTSFVSLPDEVEWWKLFGVEMDSIEEISSELMRLYEIYSSYTLDDARQLIKRLVNQSRKRENNKKQSSSNHRSTSRHRSRKRSEYEYRREHRSRSRRRHHREHRQRSRSHSRHHHYRY